MDSLMGGPWIPYSSAWTSADALGHLNNKILTFQGVASSYAPQYRRCNPNYDIDDTRLIVPLVASLQENIRSRPKISLLNEANSHTLYQ